MRRASLSRSSRRTRAARKPGILCLSLAMGLLLSSAPALAQMDVESIAITSGPAYASGAFTDFFLDPEVAGSGIASVRLFRQNGAFVDLIEDPAGTWACDEVIPSGPCEGFPTLNDVRALGDLTFSLSGTLGESDIVVVPFADWDPGSGQPGVPTITAPTSGEVGVSLTPTFVWPSAPGWVDAILANVQIAATGDDVEEALLPETDTSWQPAPLPAGTQLDFRLSFFDVIFVDDPRASPESDAYLFTSAFESFNFVPFRTVGPVPGLGLVGGSLLTIALAASGRRLLGRSGRGSHGLDHGPRPAPAPESFPS